MARTRRVETSEILDAAERVVVRLGAVGLSLDAVAKEAGISKTRVVYDFKTKAALIEAVLDRQMDGERAKIKAAVERSKATPHPELFGRLLRMQEVPSELDKAVCMAITASIANGDAIHAKMQDWIEMDVKAMDTGERPRAALVAHMALIGFFSQEWFGFKTWSASERTRILNDIEAVYRSFPDTK